MMYNIGDKQITVISSHNGSHLCIPADSALLSRRKSEDICTKLPVETKQSIWKWVIVRDGKKFHIS